MYLSYIYILKWSRSLVSDSLQPHGLYIPWNFPGQNTGVGGGGGLVTKSCLPLVNPWIVPCQAPLSMGFPKQEYWSGLPFPSPGDLPNPGMEPRSPALQADSLSSEPPGKPLNHHYLGPTRYMVAFVFFVYLACFLLTSSYSKCYIQRLLGSLLPSIQG